MTEETDTQRTPPVLTNALTDDQRGWAKQRHPEHYRTPGAKWYVNKDKPAIPTPAGSPTKPTKRRRHH